MSRDGASVGSKVWLLQSLLVRGKKKKHRHVSYITVQRVGSCDPLCKMKFWWERLPMDIHLAVKYAVNHSKAVLAMSFLQCWPAKTVEHGSYTAGSIKVASDIAGTPALNHFDFVGVALNVWVPHRWSIFHSWSDVGSISHLLDLSTAPRNVSGKEGTCWVGPLHNCINMCIKG